MKFPHNSVNWKWVCQEIWPILWRKSYLWSTGVLLIFIHTISKAFPSLLFCELDKESETRKFLKYFLKMSKHQGEKNPNLLICASFWKSSHLLQEIKKENSLCFDFKSYYLANIANFAGDGETGAVKWTVQILKAYFEENGEQASHNDIMSTWHVLQTFGNFW